MRPFVTKMSLCSTEPFRKDSRGRWRPLLTKSKALGTKMVITSNKTFFACFCHNKFKNTRVRKISLMLKAKVRAYGTHSLTLEATSTTALPETLLATVIISGKTTLRHSSRWAWVKIIASKNQLAEYFKANDLLSCLQPGHPLPVLNRLDEDPPCWNWCGQPARRWLLQQLDQRPTWCRNYANGINQLWERKTMRSEGSVTPRRSELIACCNANYASFGTY